MPVINNKMGKIWQKCTLRNCKNYQNKEVKDDNIIIHGLPRNEKAKKRWLDAIPEGLLEKNSTHYSSIHICSLHFTQDSYFPTAVGGRKRYLKKNACPTLFDLTVPSGSISTEVDHSKNEITGTNAGVEAVVTRRCRTCLEVTDAKQCVEITKKFYLEKTIKETIIILVPEMKSTIFDEESVCKTCYRVLRSSLKFIERCLETELIIAEEKRRFEEYEDLPLDQVSETEEQFGDLVVDTEHNYYSRNNVDGVPVTILPKTYSKKSENSCQYNGSLINDLSLLETSKDEYKDDIVIEYCDLLQESKIYDDFDFAVNVLKEEVTFTCQTCSEKFSADDYELHIEHHPPFICKQCGKAFTTKLKLSYHLQIHKEHYQILCDICGKLVKNSLEVHKSSHNKERPYMCHQCPKTFKTKEIYKKHEAQSHKRLNRQQCHVCGLTFHCLNMCRKHYRLKHLKLKPFMCKVCGKKFGRKDYLKNHMGRHTNENQAGRINKLGFRLKCPGQPVTCKICDKKISSLMCLKAHLWTHTKLKKHKCKYCNLLFTLSANRNRHEKSHEVNHEYKFRCDICWKRTKTEEELEKHLLVHKKRPPKHVCDTCGEKFYRKYLLSNHRMIEHLSPEDIEKVEKEIVEQNLFEYAEYPDF